MRPNGNGNHGGGNNFNRRPRNNNQGGGGNRGGGGGNNIRRPQQPTNLRNQIFDSHGPNGERVRGNAFQVHEKYQSLARDSEERVDQEAYSQHAEHYYRIVEAIQEMEAERQARFGGQPAQSSGEGGQPRQQNNYQNQQSERNEPYNGEQPDLTAPSESEEPQQQQRPRFNRDQQNRDGQHQHRRPRDEQTADGAREDQPRQRSMHERAPLEPIHSTDSSDVDDSGPIFSLADNAPVDSAEDVAPAPRRRGRPAKTDTAE